MYYPSRWVVIFIQCSVNLPYDYTFSTLNWSRKGISALVAVKQGTHLSLALGDSLDIRELSFDS